MRRPANRHVMAGKWKQLRGAVTERWGGLTRNNMRRLRGRFVKVVGVVEERYGHMEARAQKEAGRFIHRYR